MLRLVRNDFRMNAILFFMLFLLMNIMFLVVAKIRMFGGYQYGFVKIGLGISSMMILAVFLRDELSKGQVLYRSLPLSHVKIISARFLTIGIIVFGNAFYAAAIQTINGHLNPWMIRAGSRMVVAASTQMEAGYALEHSLLSRFLAMSIALSIGIPLIVRYGNIGRILGAYLILQLVWTKVVNQFLEFSMNSAFFLGLSRWMFFALLIMVVMVSISHRLSVWLYARREF